MFRGIKRAILEVFNRRTQAPTREEQAFNALVSKFAKIQYLVDQKAMVDVIEKAPVGICITNKDYVYEYVNPAYCAIYGYEPDELIGNKFTMVVLPEYQEELMRLHDEFMNQEYELEGEWQVVAKSGDLKTIQANAAYVIDEQKRPKKVTFVLDITQRRTATTALDEATGELKRLAGSLRQLVSDPLNEVSSSMKDLAEQKEISDKLEAIAREAEKLAVGLE